jgi:hypothetical protein
MFSSADQAHSQSLFGDVVSPAPVVQSHEAGHTCASRSMIMEPEGEYHQKYPSCRLSIPFARCRTISIILGCPEVLEMAHCSPEYALGLNDVQ